MNWKGLGILVACATVLDALIGAAIITFLLQAPVLAEWPGRIAKTWELFHKPTSDALGGLLFGSVDIHHPLMPYLGLAYLFGCACQTAVLTALAGLPFFGMASRIQQR